VKRLVLLALLALSVVACYGGEEVRGAVRYYHDDVRDVSCWTAFDQSITCLPDSQVTRP
jgi:hypothetical protein